MVNEQTAIAICDMAEKYYGRFFDFRGLKYYNPIMNSMQTQVVRNNAAMMHDNFLSAPKDIRVSCRTDTILPEDIGGLEPARMLKTEGFADLVEVSNCEWRCFNAIAKTATTVGDVRKLFNVKIANRFRINLGAYMDTGIRNLMLQDIPTMEGTKISAAQDGIKTVTVDSLDAFEATLRNAIHKEILSNSFEDVGDIIIYGDKDLQATMTNAAAMGNNAFGGCCTSEFAANIVKCPGSSGVPMLAYNTPLVELPNAGGKFFPEEGGYRTYFVVSGARAMFGFDADYVREKMDDCCAVTIPFTPDFMQKFVGCEYISAYHEIFDRIMGQAWFFIKETKNPVHKKHLFAEYELGGAGGFSRRPSLGFLLKVKTTIFDQYLSNNTLVAKNLVTPTAVTQADEPIPTEFINDIDPKNDKVKPTNKKV